jgi:hypothetical protein
MNSSRPDPAATPEDEDQGISQEELKRLLSLLDRCSLQQRWRVLSLAVRSLLPTGEAEDLMLHDVDYKDIPYAVVVPNRDADATVVCSPKQWEELTREIEEDNGPTLSAKMVLQILSTNSDPSAIADELESCAATRGGR